MSVSDRQKGTNSLNAHTFLFVVRTIKLLSISLTGTTAREDALERMTIDLHPTMTLERVSIDGKGRAMSVVWMASERRSVILVADCRRRTCGIYTTPSEVRF